MFRVLFTSLLLWSLRAFAQEHPFLSQFDLSQLDGAVRLEWTMVAGNTCTDTRIHRSVNGGAFEVVGLLSGICGDITEPKQYSWTDTAPVEVSFLAYRLELGTNGNSSVKELFFGQLVTSEQLFFPSPADDHATLVLRMDPNGTVDLRVWDLSGRLRLERTSARGAQHELDLDMWPSGLYVYEANASGKRFTGRFLKR